MTDSSVDVPHPRQREATLTTDAARRIRYPLVRQVDHTFRLPEPALSVPAGYLRPPHPAYRLIGKRGLDIALGILMAPFALSLILVAAVALWIEGGNPFYHQDRLGRGGARFKLFKLRTMVRDADAMLEQCLASDTAMRAEWDATQKLKNDPRITPVGAFLRATSLDELPQLWNVFKGDMSLIGPRPMMPEQLIMYGDARHYFALRPGITGAWQVSKRNEDLFIERAVIDQDYDLKLSLGQDLKILWRTVGVVLRRTGY